MSYEIITVATHKEGTFEELVNNKYEKVTVLGMGKKWTGFKMKFELMYNYIKNMDDNKIIIFLDGFDSIVLHDPKKAIEIFKSKDYNLLFSRNIPNHFGGFEKMVYPSCNNQGIVNTGMYMGYVKYLKKVLELSLTKKCKSDQVVFNRLCKEFDFISIDKEEEIFKNIDNRKHYDLKNETSIFVSFPGTLNFQRIYRSLFEYAQFLLIPGLITVLLIIVLLFKFKYNIAAYIVIIIAIIWLFNMDYSCIT